MFTPAKIALVATILALTGCGQYGSRYDPITGVNNCSERLTNMPGDYRGDVRCGPQTQPVSPR